MSRSMSDRDETPDVLTEARGLLARMGKAGEVEWDSYTVPGDGFTAPHAAVAIGDHEVELRWLNGSALVARFIAASPDLVRRLVDEVEQIREELDTEQTRAMRLAIRAATCDEALAAIERVRELADYPKPVKVATGGGNLVSQRWVIDPDDLRRVLDGGEQ